MLALQCDRTRSFVYERHYAPTLLFRSEARCGCIEELVLQRKATAGSSTSLRSGRNDTL
jgi:hypothetical protein